jgi:hypothetical protein
MCIIEIVPVIQHWNAIESIEIGSFAWEEVREPWRYAPP